jgi:hypothetical protein
MTRTFSTVMRVTGLVPGIAGSCSVVMPGLVPGIHVFVFRRKAWMRGPSPRMTARSMLDAHAGG